MICLQIRMRAEVNLWARPLTLYRNLQTGRSLLQGLLLQAAQRIKKRKNGLRKPASHDNMQIIIVKFVDSFLDGCLLAPV